MGTAFFSERLNTMKNLYVTSRSAYQAFLNSPRLFYATYCAQGSGITKKVMSHHLAIGIFVHEVCGAVMSGCSEANAMKQHSDKFLELSNTRTLDTNFSPDVLLALAQGLAKSWIRVRLSKIKKEYEILAVEKERKLSLHDNELQILLPVRLDAELKHKKVGTFHALELKTVSTRYDYVYEKYNFDIQPLMHTWVMVDTWGECCNIMMEFLFKGVPARKPDVNGVLYWNSVFTKGWEKLAVPPFSVANKTEYTCEYAKGRRVGWDTISVPDRFTQDEWHKKMGKKLDEVVTMRSVVREQDHLPDFQYQLFATMKRIVEGLCQLKVTTDPQERQILLNTYFPLSYHDYDKHLIGVDVDDEELIESGEWVRREPHHSLEIETSAKLTI